jgi:hypothetical protein
MDILRTPSGRVCEHHFGGKVIFHRFSSSLAPKQVQMILFQVPLQGHGSSAELRIFARLQRQCLHGFQDILKICYETMQLRF